MARGALFLTLSAAISAGIRLKHDLPNSLELAIINRCQSVLMAIELSIGTSSMRDA